MVRGQNEYYGNYSIIIIMAIYNHEQEMGFIPGFFLHLVTLQE